MKSAYVALVEVVPEPGCALDPSEVAGAIVRCYVASESEDAALAAVKRQLESDRFRVVEVEWCVNGRQTEWENPGDEDAEACMVEAEQSDEVIYGRFDAWT
jgi:hypothetical protein